MTASALRNKLYDYIRVADEKKLKAIYVMLENEIEETIEWWKDKAFVAELDEEYKAWKKGETKGYSIEEAKASVERLRQKRNK